MNKVDPKIQEKREKLRPIVDLIRSGKYEFDMTEVDVRPACGTAGCIAGHIAMKFPSCRESTGPNGGFTFNRETISRKFGMSDEESYDLFFHTPTKDKNSLTKKVYSAEMAYYDSYDLNEISRGMAAGALERFIDTGVVNFRLRDATKSEKKALLNRKEVE